MDSNEIRYCIDNQERIYEELETIMENLPQETCERFKELFEDGNMEEVYNIINNVSPDNVITLSSLKLLTFLENIELKDKLFSNEEYINILKELVDMYGERLSEIMDINSRSFNMSDLDSLLSFDDPKYSEVYKSILEKKLTSTFFVKDGIEVLKNSNISVISEELIIKFLENYSYSMMGSEAEELLQILPNSILQDGIIAKTMLRKMGVIVKEDVKILDYIPSNAYDQKFVNEILEKSKFFDEVFDKIPTEFRTRNIWERICDKYPNYLNSIPNNNIDPSISQEEYNYWFEDLIISVCTKIPENFEVFHVLDDSKKTIRMCQKIAETIYFENSTYEYKKLLELIPENCKTQKLYETLVSKSPYAIGVIPLKSFISNVPQEEYDKWFENLILQSIDNAKDMKELSSIPRVKVNEKVWNKLLDKCIEVDADRHFADLSIVDFENITPQMVERAMKDINHTQLYEVPCIDRNIDEIYDSAIKEKYAKWQSSFNEEQKQAYRTWYEQIWIKFVNKYHANVYSNVPKEGITTNMNKACIDVEVTFINQMPVPENSKQLHEYQQMLIYALSKTPTIDYKITNEYDNKDIFEHIPRKYINEEVVKTAITKNLIYLVYVDPTAENFTELVDVAFKNKLVSMGRTELTPKEHELMQKFALNNADFFKTLQLEILDPKIVNAIGESSLEKITRYKDVQSSILRVARDENALKTFGFALENLKMDNIFIEPIIEKLSKSISSQRTEKYSSEAKGYVYESAFLDLVSQRIDRQDIPFTDYEKSIISYLSLNPQEGRKITSYDDILTFVERKNIELENIVNNVDSTLLEVKNAYLERLVGLNYESVVNLVNMYGNDPELLLQNYNNIDPEAFKELSEKEALEIIIKLKSFIETQDINVIKSEFQRYISQEQKEDSFIRYQKSTTLETTLRRAYGRDMVNSLSKNADSLYTQEFEFEGEKYLVRKVNGNFNRMVSLLDAYRKSSTTDADMYDKWNTSQMASNHALCYSLINQSNPGTAMINDKNGIIISIDGFSTESILAEAPYDLSSDNRHNTIFTLRQQRFFSAQNMPNQTRGMYSEYDIEIQDVLSGSEKYKKIQPATIICFEEIDKDSIKAAIELGKKLGHPVPIELIDRRQLAKNEMKLIIEALNSFKSGSSIEPTLVNEIITRFNNVRNAHRFSKLSDELLGENKKNENKDAPFNIEHLNQILKECLENIEQRIRNGQVQDGLKALEIIKMIIFEERQKSFLMPTMYEKQLWTGIDMNIDYTLDELQRIYGKQLIEPLEKIKTLEILSKMKEQSLSSISLKSTMGNNIPEQLSIKQMIQLIDVNKIQKSIDEIHSEGYYQGNKFYDEEHIARVILFSDAISKMDGFDDKTRELITEVSKYYSCGRQLDIPEQHEQYSAKLAGKALTGKFSQDEIKMIQATIELQNFKSNSHILSEIEEERKTKLTELCGKYGISEEQAVVVSKMASCVSDSVILDQTRFVDKAKNNVPEQNFRISYLHSESAKKMVECSYLIQEQLAQQELDRLSSVVQVNFETEKEKIMKEFFTKILFNGQEDKTKDESITQSPIVRLEYLKTKYPEIAKIDLNAFQKQKQSKFTIKEIKSSKVIQLEAQIRDLRRQQFEARVSKLGLQDDQFLTLDKLFQQQEFMKQHEHDTKQEIYQGMKI